MKGSIGIFLSDSIIKISFYTSLVIIVLQVLLTGFFFNNLPPLIPFFNSQPWGSGRLTSPWATLILLVFIFGAFVFNNVLAISFYAKHTLISRIISFNTLLFIFLGFLAFLQILLLVF